MARPVRITLRDAMEIELPSGKVVTIFPSPDGGRLLSDQLEKPSPTEATDLILGLNRDAPPSKAVIDALVGLPRRGKPASELITELRQLIATDVVKNQVKPAAHYVSWLVQRAPKKDFRNAQNLVYRDYSRLVPAEMVPPRPKKEKPPPGQPGRPPSSAALAARKRMARDSGAKRLSPPVEYERWLIREFGLSRVSAKSLAHREWAKLQNNG